MNQLLTVILVLLAIVVILYGLMLLTSVTRRTIFVGGCEDTRWGCCSDEYTPKADRAGTNCPQRRLIGGCSGTRFGCCPDGRTAKMNRRGTNC